MGSNDSVSAGKDCSSEKKVLNPLASCIFSLPPKQFALLSSVIGLTLIENLDLGQQNSLGNFIVSVGSTILTAAAQGQLLETNIQNAADNQNAADSQNNNSGTDLVK